MLVPLQYGDSMEKIILIEVENIEKYPPVISVLNCLCEIRKYELVLITVNPSNNIREYCENNNVKLYVIEENRIGTSLLSYASKLINYRRIHKELWNHIMCEYNDDSIIWVFSVVTLKYLGRELTKYKYILHLFELLENLSLFAKIPYPKVPIIDYCQKAYKVIECEYNRAHITQLWFGLEKKPVVLPNKLFMTEEPDYSNHISKKIYIKMEELKYKRIILYQGIISDERPVEPFIEAVENMDDLYHMVVLTGSKIPESWKTYKKLTVIPFIPAPFHLYLTQKAFIGLLCYYPSRKGYSYTSPLNSIYCAPNKIFEYSRYSVPMIGNDIPGLQYTIGLKKAGVCITSMDVKSIEKAICEIEKSYEEFCNNSNALYTSVDVKKIIDEDILN